MLIYCFSEKKYWDKIGDFLFFVNMSFWFFKKILKNNKNKYNVYVLKWTRNKIIEKRALAGALFSYLNFTAIVNSTLIFHKENLICILISITC